MFNNKEKTFREETTAALDAITAALQELSDQIAEIKQNSSVSADKTSSLQQQVDGMQSRVNEVVNMCRPIPDMSRMVWDVNRYINPELMTHWDEDPDKLKVLVIGFYGAPNLGDELMALTILDHLRKYVDGGKIEITLMNTNSEHFDVSIYGPVRIIHYPHSVFDYNTLANHYDALIVGGGAILDDHPEVYGNFTPGWLNIGSIVVGLAKAFQVFGKKTYFVGLSTNTELTNQEYIAELKEVAGKADCFSIRDSNSINTFRQAGFDCDIELVHDNVFAENFFVDGRLEKMIERKSQSQRREIVISWIIADETSESKLLELTEELVNMIDERDIDVSIKWISFLEEFATDSTRFAAAYEKLSDEAKSRTAVLEYTSDIETLCDELTNAFYTFNMRYHAGVLNGIVGNRGTNVIWTSHRHYLNKVSYITDHFNGFDIVHVADVDAKAYAAKALSFYGEDASSYEPDYETCKEANEKMKKILADIVA